MKLINTFAAACFIASVSAWAAPGPTIASPDAPLPESTLTRKGLMTKLDSSIPIYLTVEKNPKAEIIFRNIFTKRGYNVVNEPGAGVTTLKMEGLLEVGMIKMRTHFFGLDDFVDNPDAVKAAADPSSMYAKGHLAAASSGAINLTMLATGVTNLASAVGGFGTALGDATGVSGKFNQAFTGDSRGICIWPCDDWNKYFQTVVLEVEKTTPDGNTTKSGIKVLVKNEMLYPIQIFQAALATLSADLLGDPMPNIFSKNTVVE